MECIETKQFTEEEKRLAAEFCVEPKLIRLLDSLIRLRLGGSRTAKIGVNLEPEGSRNEKEVTTGIKILDYHIRNLTWDAMAASFVLMELSWLHNPLGDRICNVLQTELKPFTQADGVQKLIADKGDPDTAIEVEWWLSFFEGFKTGEKATE